MRLVVTLGSTSIEFASQRDTTAARPFLISTGTLRLAARVGQVYGTGATESSSISVSLDRRAADVLGRPLRTAAALFGDDGEELFAGTVAALSYGNTFGMTIEA